MRRGFTLIETLVVAAIVILVSVGGFLGLAQYRNKQALGSGLNEIRAATEGVKRQSVTQEQGTRWGVRFTNATSGVSSYSIFRGVSYSTSGVDHVYSLRSPVRFGNPSASSTYDAVFAPLSGALSENKVLTVIGGSAGLVGDLILRTVGSITARMDNGLVGYWHFDEGTSTLALDASGHGNTGTLTNGPTWMSGTSCKAGDCVGFDTAAWKYINVANSNSIDVRTNLTLEAWVYPTGTGGGEALSTIIFGSGSGYYLSYNDSGKAISCYWYGTTPPGYHTTASDTVPLNQWSHVVCTWDGANINQYVNGALSKTVAVTGAGTGVDGIRIGGENTVRQFQGYIDEVRIYARTLSPDEILAHYNDLK